MEKIELKLKTGEFFALDLEIKVLKAHPKMDFLTLHKLNRIQKIIKPILDSFSETKKLLFEKYGGKDGKMSEFLDEEKTLKNPNIELFLKEVQQIEDITESVEIVPLEIEGFEKYDNESIKSMWVQTAQYNIFGFEFIHQIFVD